jgi:hypothetical protein
VTPRGRGGRDDGGHAQSPPTCPVCGDMVPAGSRSCPGCGADEETGWGTGSIASDAEFTEDDYDEFVRDEIDDAPIETSGPSRFGFLLVVLLVLVVAGLLALLTTAKSQ